MLSDLLTKHYPRFETIIPSTKKLITFRPILVKEEKKLLTIQEFGSEREKINCIVEVLEKCFDYRDIRSLTLVDIQYLFIQLRIKSIGSSVNPVLVCPYTNENINLQINLEEITITQSTNKSNTIELGKHLSIEMSEPTVNMLLGNKISLDESVFNMALSCMKTIYTPEESISCEDQSREDLESFLDKMTREDFSKIVDYFKNISRIEKTVAYKTSDGIEREITLKGIIDFFV